MTTYSVRVIGHDRPVQVEVGSIEFATPLSDPEARFAIAQVIAKAVLPDVHAVRAGKELERDATGQIQRSIDRPAVARNVVAAQVGWEVAGAVLAGAADE